MVSLHALFGKDPNQPNFCSIADGVIICGAIGSLGSPYVIFWSSLNFIDSEHSVCIDIPELLLKFIMFKILIDATLSNMLMEGGDQREREEKVGR